MKKITLSRIVFYGYILASIGAMATLTFARNLPRNVVFEMVVGVVILYLVSVLAHHVNDKTLTFEIVIEYILLAGLTIVMMVSFFI